MCRSHTENGVCSTAVAATLLRLGTGVCFRAVVVFALRALVAVDDSAFAVAVGVAALLSLVGALSARASSAGMRRAALSSAQRKKKEAWTAE